jgi:hypothetical protein
MPGFSLLRMIARFTAGLSHFAAIALMLLVIMLSVPLVGAMADWLVKQREGTKTGVRPFLWKDSDAPPPGCVGKACGMASLPMTSYKQVDGNNSPAVIARMRWPAPVQVEASPDAYLEVVGVTNSRTPTVERGRGPVKPRSDDPADDPEQDTRPLVLANEVYKDGRRRPILVDTEGFLSAWVQAGEGVDEQLKPWTPPAELATNEQSQKAAIARLEQWRSLKMRRVQFQPISKQVEVDVLRANLLNPIPVGHVMVFDWQASGVIDGVFRQVVPSRSMLGLVVGVQEIGQYMRLNVQIPRSSPYGSGHWLWQHLNGAPQGSKPLPSEVRAVFFEPSTMLGVTPDWNMLERIFQKLPLVDVLSIPTKAVDLNCVEPAAASNACIWVRLNGVAVPVQVGVQPLANGELSVRERAVFVGKALRSSDWAAMPREFRREFGSPSALGVTLNRSLLSSGARALLIPQPWLKPGLPVSVSETATGIKP